MPRIWLALGLGVALVGALARAQPPAPATTAPTTTTPRPARVGPALRSCLPGHTFASCNAALDGAHATPLEGAPSVPMRRSVALRSPWLSADIGADSGGRITSVRFEGTHAGAARRQLFRAFDTPLTRIAFRGSASPGIVCPGSGPAWYENEEARANQTPRVELTVDPIGEIPDLTWPVDRIFLESTDEGQRVCLAVLAPPPEETHDRIVAALGRWLASAPF